MADPVEIITTFKRGTFVVGTDTTDLNTSDADIHISKSALAASSVTQVLESFAHGAVVAIWIAADHAGSLKTNSSSSPDNTIPFVAGKATFWPGPNIAANPFTVDVGVNGIYIVNNAGAILNIDIYIWLNI